MDLLLDSLNETVKANNDHLAQQILSLRHIDETFSRIGFDIAPKLFIEHISNFGWSHAILRRIVLVRESLDGEDDEIERLVWSAGLESNSLAVTSLIHAYATEQNYLTVKRSTLNVADRGIINRYSRAIARITFQPFAKDRDDLFAFLSEITRCSLVDATILVKFNSHLCELSTYSAIRQACDMLGRDSVVSGLIKNYRTDDRESEYLSFKQCGVWLEYSMVLSYRILVDHFYDASRDVIELLPPALHEALGDWIGSPDIGAIVMQSKVTNHRHEELAELEASGNVTRSAIFNYWLASCIAI
ncbi:hypothetical protein SAMN06265784_12077 [Paraburkholderia susongensis]|uniref:Uncharacterized protein n=2 Tax=Paraburkholderia susongensis TaxID=1515439 RepID=A0A1X7M715_9BURK|nr:hypothetical protein SAMN06265784_12077 [Paraburkholderia susongensis]